MRRFGLIMLAFGLLTATQGAAWAQQKNPVVVLDTTLGRITVELFADKAPITVKNFLTYVDEKHFDNTIFHRVIPDFMIQGGGMEPGLKEKQTHAGIKNESNNGLSNEKGTLAMARLPNMADSATSQFFINVKDNPFLDKGKGMGSDRFGYAVFGKVIEGMDVVDAIRRVETGDRGSHSNVPAKDVILRTARRK